MGGQAAFIKALLLPWVIGQNNDSHVSFCLYWWDFSPCDLTRENAFAPVHTPLFPPPRVPTVPVPEMELVATRLGGTLSSSGVNGLACSASWLLFLKVWERGKRCAGVQVPEPTAAQSRWTFLGNSPRWWIIHVVQRDSQEIFPFTMSTLWLLNALMFA